MDLTVPDRDWLVSLRRELHRRPEPAWREFYTTARVVEQLRRIGTDDLYVGPEALAAESRTGLPAESELADWLERARETGVSGDVLDHLEGGHTGAVAVLERGEGPTVALRVDIDGLARTESADPDHLPAREGFRSENEGAMHACGHDAHATIGLGVFRALAASDFAGTFKLLVQPAEERIGGGKALAESGHVDDVDHLLAVHVGLDHPTGEVVAGIDDFLAVRQFEANFEGEGAHAGGHPNRGHNAVQAMATAVQNLYGIARHEDGATRVNAGKVGGGTASNIVPEEAFIEGEARGETTALMEYTYDRARTILHNAAEMHDCSVTVENCGDAPSARSDDEIVDAVAEAARGVAGVDSIRRRDALGGSEDATYLLRRVQRQGGTAGYVCIGTDHPGGHHTATFDVDEDSLEIGVGVLARAVLALAD